MKKVEFVYRELLYQLMERKKNKFTQAGLAKTLGISLSTVNLAIKPLRKMGAVEVRKRGLTVREAKKILYYWASIRNLEKDIVYSTRAEMPVREIERNIPATAVYSAYTAYKLKFKDVPADYSEVYVYCDEKEIKERFKESKKQPNLFILKKDRITERYGRTATTAQLFVDLWNLKGWYATEFLKAMEGRINGILE